MRRNTRCQCEITGEPKQYCNRHQCYKSPTEVRLCQLNIPKFREWENCQGHGQDEDCVPARPDKNDEIRPHGTMGVGQYYKTPPVKHENEPEPKKPSGCPFCNKKDKTEDQKQTIAEEQQSKKRPPTLLSQGWNFAAAVTKYVKSGMQNTLEEDFAERMKICEGCEWRSNNRCMKCGCFIDKKASWASADCPIGKWPKLSE